jgi:hypothetical protein
VSTPANFNGAKPIIHPSNAVMLLIDHQSGLFQTIKDMPFTEVRANAVQAVLQQRKHRVSCL